MSSSGAQHSRRRPANTVVGLADGTVWGGGGEEEEEAASGGGTCALAQVGAGVLFAFLFGSLGFILTGDATRSLLWLVGLVVGASLGVFATRGGAGGGGGGGSSSA